MSTKQAGKSAHEPGWGEVILGATLSIVLGAALGAVALVLRPVAQVKELPKEPVKGVTYVIEGSRDLGKAKQAAAKRKAFVAGQSVTVTEDEINSLVGPQAPAPQPGAKPGAAKQADPKAKAAQKAAPAPAAPPPSDEMFALGAPNVRMRDGLMQVIVPVTISLLGQQVTVVGNGKWAKKDGGFAFEAETLQAGCCPMQRIPFAAGYVAKKFLHAVPIPEDIASAWGKLADVAIEGSTLKLTMP